MKLGKLVSNLKVKVVNGLQAARCGRTDYGIVKVAFMVAALDGEVSDDEMKAIDALLKKCRGYSKESAAKVLDEAMRAAGYLMLFGKRAEDADLVKAFVAEAKAALPDGFAYLSVEEVRRAVVTWIALGMSDGDYSAREKLCIEALRTHFAELKITRDQAEEERWRALSQEFPWSCESSECAVSVNLVSEDFVKRVEGLIAQYGDSADAEAELEKLIGAV